MVRKGRPMEARVGRNWDDRIQHVGIGKHRTCDNFVSFIFLKNIVQRNLEMIKIDPKIIFVCQNFV